jgi:DNA polymerase
MTILWFDCETYSECDLKAHGTPVYAAHPSTEITVAQWAIDDREPQVCDVAATAGYGIPPQLAHALLDPSITVVAHNSMFDRTLLRRVWGIDVPVERWQDTMVRALAHGLPGSLDKLSGILNLASDEAKDKRGRDLIQLFCKPRPTGHKLRRATRETHPTEWAEFLEYSHRDIVAMRAVHKKLPGWNYAAGSPELTLWHLDQRINDRGFAVDLDLAHAAIDAVAVEQARLKAQTRELTDGQVSSPSKRDELLAHILMEYGVSLPDMKADTLRRRIEDPELPDPVKLLLSIRLEATKTSTAKYKALVKASSADGRLRNTLQFAGAQRTARWAGRTFQPQNMPRPDLEQDDIDLAIDALKAGCAPLVLGDVMRATANTVRGCIVAPPGKKLVVADLSNIEGRGLAYVAGETWKVRAFREFDAGRGADLYKLAYARAFNIDAKDVEKWQRQIGKVMELGLGYEGGVAAFLTFAAVYNMDLDELAEAVWGVASAEALEAALGMWAWASKKRRTLGLSQRIYVACEILKAAWRAAHPATVSLWADLGNAARQAIQRPGEVFRVRTLAVRRDGSWLRIRLPSGRYLCYINPEVGDDGQISYMGVNQYTRQWAKIKTYGGKLVENVVQAWARDVLASNMAAIDQAGYEIVLTVHDELLTETPDSERYSSTELARLMSVQPAWAPDVPLAAAGFETLRYRKD